MTKEKLALFTFLSVIVILNISGCNKAWKNMSNTSQSPHPEWISRLLNNPTCEPPCWENIYPGTTSIWDVVPTLNQVDNIINLNGPKESFHGDLSVTWEYNDEKTGGRILSDENGIVSQILLAVNYEHKFFLDEILFTYGNPNYLKVYDCEKTRCSVSLYYIDHGFAVYLKFINVPIRKKTIEITADEEILSLTFFPPGEQGYLEVFGTDPWDKPRIEWQGYGEYDNPLRN